MEANRGNPPQSNTVADTVADAFTNIVADATIADIVANAIDTMADNVASK